LENEVIKLNSEPGSSASIDLSGETNAEYTSELGYGWSIAVGFDLEEIQEDVDYISIFSHSSNDCYQFIIGEIKDKDKFPQFQFWKKGGKSSTSA